MTPRLERILLVEDDPDVRTVARMALELVGGFHVRTCSSGAEALDAVSQNAPQLILLDVMMPGMDGPAVLQQLRASPLTRGITVIFMTAMVQPAQVEQLRALGALDVIAKPFDPMTLAETVGRIWARQDAC